MNLPNLLTMSRVPLMFIIVGLMYADFAFAASLAFWLFIWGTISDWLDGHLARRRNIVSNFGKLMDALTDKIMVIGIMIALVDKHQLPVSWALLTMCREFLISGMRMVAASKGVVVAADKGGKTKTVTQLIALGFLLAVPMVQEDWARFAPFDLSAVAEWTHWVGLLSFVAGTFFALWSGYRYFTRYRVLVFSDDDK
ncbi:MAG: CDP-diacylglycerol--glycerol-3-phosphate 3-phosphatidyltransferase [Opitutae bacterium]|nr:CDP-diacylglycerol--glycerol-3-phosphate 3-phosphatidyltransferase [Opitutae bacterium]